VFSLACVLVYAARGTGPFGTGDPLAIAHRSASGEPDLSGVPADVQALVKPMLQRDPALRPSPAQLLQHVALSSHAVLHDGLWLPDGVRALLSQRKQELQQALSGAVRHPTSDPDPTAAEAPAPRPATPYLAPPAGRPAAAAYSPQYGAPYPGRPEAQSQSPLPPSLRPTAAASNPSNPSIVLAAPSGPAQRSRKGFIVLLSIGGVAVMAAAVAAVLLLANMHDDTAGTPRRAGRTPRP
jgi:serine/threonine protein kinase